MVAVLRHKLEYRKEKAVKRIACVSLQKLMTKWMDSRGKLEVRGIKIGDEGTYPPISYLWEDGS